MTDLIPVDRCDEVGVRPIIDEKQADEVLEQLGTIQVDVTQNWNRRYRENMLRIRSGDLLEVARVIKCLMMRDSEKGLSTGDRKMLRSAKQILISELVLSKNSSYEAVEEEVNAALA
jgi:CarD family transcriptional regulator